MKKKLMKSLLMLGLVIVTGCENEADQPIVKELPVVSTPSAGLCIGSNMNLTPNSGGTWVSSDATKATVTNAGLVTGLAASAGVTFTFTDNTTTLSSTTSSVVINALPVVSTPSADLCIGCTMNLSPNSAGTWVSSDATKATVTNAGLVTGVAASTGVTFTFSNGTTTCGSTTSSVAIVAPIIGQWQQSAGTAGLNMQALLTNGVYNFAGGETGTYKSIDAAANYLLSNSGNDAVGPTRGYTKDNTYVYTCTSQGIFRSSDNGSTWVSKSAGLTDLRGSGVLNVGSRLVYVSPIGVFISTNQGDSWKAAGLSGTDARSIAAINETLFVGTNGAGIYKSTDWGVNWLAVNNGLNGATNFRAIESKGNTLFAAGPTGTGVFRSLDLGANWTLLSGGLASSSYRGFASNTDIIVAGSFGAGVFYSKDNGNTWTTINAGLSDLTIFDLELNDKYIVAATNTKGVFRFALSNIK